MNKKQSNNLKPIIESTDALSPDRGCPSVDSFIGEE